MTPAALAGIAIRITAVVVVAAGLNAARRRASAAERHWLWVIALAGTLAMPLASALLPPVRFLPTPTTAAAPLPITEPGATRTASPAAALVATVAAERPAVGIAPLSPIPSSIPSRRSAFQLLLLVWASGTLLSLARLAGAHRRARGLVSRGRAAERIVFGRRSVPSGIPRKRRRPSRTASCARPSSCPTTPYAGTRRCVARPSATRPPTWFVTMPCRSWWRRSPPAFTGGTPRCGSPHGRPRWSASARVTTSSSARVGARRRTGRTSSNRRGAS